MEVVAVGAHVDVVEPAAGGPKELRPDREALAAGIEDRLAVRLERLPVLRLLEAELVVDVLAVVDAPLVVGVGHAPLLAVERHCAFRRCEVLLNLGLVPEVGDVFEEAGLDVGPHPVRRVPVRDVRRIGGQEVPDLRLVRFAINDRQLDVEVGMHLVEARRHVLHHGTWRRIRHVRKDRERSRQVLRARGSDDRGGHRQRRRQTCKAEHEVLPKPQRIEFHMMEPKTNY